MKISFNWLRELVELAPGVTAEAVGQRLTLAGLEVESIERRGRDLRGVRVAEVRSVAPHPNAEKLSIVRIYAGGAEEEVVCGAPNVPAAGGKVAWAAPQAQLPGGHVDLRQVRGVWSPGMLCSEIELGVGDDADGILILPSSATPGANVAMLIGLIDEVLEVNVTPNRPDALSHVGIAREVAALFNTRWKMPPPEEAPTGPIPPGRGMDVEIRDPNGCPRYTARLITGVRVAKSPLPMRIRLAACGVRPISNVVDATNYVMLETGHPLHAFDLARLQGGIIVRRAAKQERITTLDGVDRALQESDMVIADHKGPVALAGVMGGATTEVSERTIGVLLEAAAFDPRSVRRTAKRLGLHSEASHRFERGVDANGVRRAGARAAAMIARLAGGTLAGEVVDRYPQTQHPRQVSLSMAGLRRIAGFEIPIAQAAEKLGAIGIASEVGESGLVATIPTYRPDVSIEEDLAEEVLRLVGYDKIPSRLPVGGAAPTGSAETFGDRARSLLAAHGLNEVITWAFVPRSWLSALVGGRKDHPLASGVAVKNPISADYEVMRTSLLPGLVDAARRNVSRGTTDFGLFEVGPVVRRGATDREAPAEPTMVAAILVGRRPGWLKPGEPLDFFDGKQIVDDLVRGLGIPTWSYAPAREPVALHPGVSADVFIGGDRAVGSVGEIHPAIGRSLGLEAKALYLELQLDAIAGQRIAIRSVPPPRFPAVTRDVSFWIEAKVPAAAQRQAFLSAAEPLLRQVDVVEDFRDPRYAPEGKKGMLWSMTYRADDRTLTDTEVDAAHARVVAALRAAADVQVR